MTWVALADHTERRFSLRGIGVDKCPEPILPDRADHLMVQGSLVFETQLDAQSGPRTLLGYRVAAPQKRSLIVQIDSDGTIVLEQEQGRHLVRTTLAVQPEERTETIRITYSWNCYENRGLLSVEHPNDNALLSVAVDTPLPIPLGDLRDMMMGRGEQIFAADVLFAALSDQVEPIGPSPTLASDSFVATPWGYKKIGGLKRGDTVVTASGAVVPVLYAVSRVVPARGSWQPMRLRAPFFGLQTDAIMAPTQRLVVDGPEVEYLFSQEAVLMQARHMENGFAAMPEPVVPTVRYTQLLLPGHEVVQVAGAHAESLYIGRLRRKPAVLKASVFAAVDRGSLPEHAKPVHQVLKRYEAVTLAKRRAA